MVIIINILVAFITMQSCVTATNLKKDEIVIDKELCSIKSIPGGSRAHIFLVSKKGELSYCIGQVLNFEYGKFDVDKKYKVKTIMSCPEIAIHKNSVYGKPRTRNLCFEGAQAEPL